MEIVFLSSTRRVVRTPKSVDVALSYTGERLEHGRWVECWGLTYDPIDMQWHSGWGIVDWDWLTDVLDLLPNLRA